MAHAAHPIRIRNSDRTEGDSDVSLTPVGHMVAGQTGALLG